MFKSISGLFVIYVLCFILFWSGVIYLGVKLASEIQSAGLKSIIETIWEGPEK